MLPVAEPSTEDLWRSNLTAVQRRFPQVAQALREVRGDLSDLIRVKPARSGELTMSMAGPAGEQHLHSAYDPQGEAVRWVRGLEDGDWPTIAVFGFGLGYHVELLLRQYPGRKVVVAEVAPEVLAAALRSRDLTSVLANPALHLVLSPDPATVASRIHHTLFGNLTAMPRLVAWPPAGRVQDEAWRAVQRWLLDLLRSARTNMITIHMLALRWVENALALMRLAVRDPGIPCLLTPFAGRPAIIVAAGPSLERNAELLKEAKGKALIAAAGSAVNPLVRRGIMPDFVVSIDGSQANYRHFEHLDSRGLPLVYGPTLYPEIARAYKGPRFVASLPMSPYGEWVFRRLGLDKGELHTGPSVSNVTFDLFRRMGCNPIIFVGQDLAFTGNKTHAEGAAHARALGTEELAEADLLTVEAWDGGQVVCSRSHLSMRVTLEAQIRSLEPGRECINATEGGARIRGTRAMRLEEAMAAYCREEFHPYETLLRLHREEHERLAALPLDEQLDAAGQELLRGLQGVHKMAQRGLALADKLEIATRSQRFNLQQFAQAADRFNQMNEDLSRNEVYNDFAVPVIEAMITSTNSILLNTLNQTPDLREAGAILVTLYRRFFGAVRDVTAQVRGFAREHLA